MKITIPRVVRPVDFSKYSPEMEKLQEAGGGPGIYMWVSVTREARADFQKRQATFWAALKALTEEAGRIGKDLKRDRKNLDRLGKALQEATDQVYAWWADAWSQGEPATHVSLQTVKELAASCRENDPQLWTWIFDECWRLVEEWEGHIKKA